MGVDQNVYDLRGENRVTGFADAGYHHGMRTLPHEAVQSLNMEGTEDPIIARLKAGLREHDEAIARLEKLVARNRGEQRKVFEGMLSVSRDYRKIAQDLLDGLLNIAERFQAA